MPPITELVSKFALKAPASASIQTDHSPRAADGHSDRCGIPESAGVANYEGTDLRQTKDAARCPIIDLIAVASSVPGRSFG